MLNLTNHEDARLIYYLQTNTNRQEIIEPEINALKKM